MSIVNASAGQGAEERLRRLYELALTVSGDPVEVFDQVVRIIAELFGVRVALVERLEAGKIYTLSMYFDGKILHEGVFELAGTPCATVREHRDFCSVTDAARRYPEDKFLQDYRIEHYIGVPVENSAGEVFAIINAMHDRPIVFGPEDISFVRALASRVRLELERAEEASEAEVVRALLDISREITAVGRGLEETLRLIADSAQGLLACDITAIATTDDAAGSNSVKAAAGFRALDPVGVHFPPGKGTAGRAFDAGRTVALEGIGRTPDLPAEEFPMMTPEGVLNSLGVPMFAGGRIVGVLIAGKRSEEKFDEQQVRLAEALAAQAAVAVENARLYAELAAANEVLERSDRLKGELLEELSTPVISVWDGVLLAPVIGTLTSERAERMTDAVLRAAVERRARHVILDVTGVRSMDTDVVRRLTNAAAAVRLVGAECVLTGVGAAVAQMLVQLGVELQGVEVRRSLSDGLRLALRGADTRESGWHAGRF